MTDRRTAGETISETLAALLLIALTFTYHAGAVVTAARVNAALRREAIAFQVADGAGREGTVSVNGQAVEVLFYEGNGYEYYVSRP